MGQPRRSQFGGEGADSQRRRGGHQEGADERHRPVVAVEESGGAGRLDGSREPVRRKSGESREDGALRGRPRRHRFEHDPDVGIQSVHEVTVALDERGRQRACAAEALSERTGHDVDEQRHAAGLCMDEVDDRRSRLVA